MIRAALVLIGLAAPAGAVTCAELTFDGQSFTACTVAADTEDLRLFHSDAGGLLGHFDAVDAATAGKLGFAMNAGMYHPDRAPVGLYVEDGVQTAPLVTRAGPGNFGMLPNGVLCLRDGAAEVIETLRFAASDPACTHATQSGPMLVIDGALHPRFIPDSPSRQIRNGVGTSRDGTTAVFAISNEPVNFHTFARLFRDHLGLDQALYLDGKVSRLYAPDLGRRDLGFALGPIIGVVGE